LSYEHYLNRLFAPKSIALVGASERQGSLGRDVLENIKAGRYSGQLYLVNPRHTALFGEACYESLSKLPSPVDLAVVATPAAALPEVLKDAARGRVRHAVVLSGGVAEAGSEPQVDTRELARRCGIRLIGPRSLGIMRPGIGLNASFCHTPARAGPIALISQSAAVCSALVDWAWSANLGFSAVVSVGAAADLDIGELLDYLQYDQETHSILLYLEGVKDARRFISGLRACARTKPIVVLKAGGYLSGQLSARTHTGLLVGSDAVFDAVLRRCGAVRVWTYDELFSAARLLAAGRIPRANRLAIVTNGGGPGVLAADACAHRHVELASFSEQTRRDLDAALPPNWSHGNPADILADADPPRLAGTVSSLVADDGVDGVLTLFSPQIGIAADEAARRLMPVVQKSAKPVLTAWLGERVAHEGRSIIEAAGMPAFSSPEAGVVAFSALAEYKRAQALLLEVPPPLAFESRPDLEGAQRILGIALSRKRTLLTEPESKHLIECFGIPTTPTIEAADPETARRAAEEMGFPVVLKILSPDISHKSDVDGVRLNVLDSAAVEREFVSLVEHVRKVCPDARIDGVAVQPMVYRRFGRELAVGIVRDPVFGPVVSVGSGGIAVELLGDSAVGLPPLSIRLADAMIDSTRMSRLLAAHRHIPAALRRAIADVLLRISDMAVSLPCIAELDINPLLADERGATALDARVVIDPASPPLDRRYSHMAIHPYPARLEQVVQLRDGTRLQVRPIRPEDAALEIAFVEDLSEQSRYTRFFISTHRLSPRMLARFTQVDYDSEQALVALEGEGGAQRIAGVARFAPLPDHVSCEFAVTIADRYHGHGLGHTLMSLIIQAAREAGYQRIVGQILGVNGAMLALARSLGFVIKSSPEDMSLVDAEFDLTAG
jgi:acetyltransferase